MNWTGSSAHNDTAYFNEEGREEHFSQRNSLNKEFTPSLVECKYACRKYSFLYKIVALRLSFRVACEFYQCNHTRPDSIYLKPAHFSFRMSSDWNIREAEGFSAKKN